LESLKESLPDVQSTTPTIRREIRQAGVQNLEVPFMLESWFGGYNDMIANVSITTNVSSDVKGISMSRLLLTLKKYLRKPLKHFLIREILEDLTQNLGSTSSAMKFEFKLPILRKSILTSNEFPLYYKCKFEGHLRTQPPEENFRFFQGVIIQYASYCPCSGELCKDLEKKGKQGFPHAQRSFAEVLAETAEPVVYLEEIIELVEKAVVIVPYPIIKRIDEQEIARIASENPMFVEDAVRAISEALDSRKDIYDWIVKCTHEESIHTSEAIAINWKGVPNGFDEKYYL